jgi:hypothetical protein
MFTVEPADLKVGDAYRPGKDPLSRTRVIAEISQGDHLGWESSDGVEYGTLHVRQFCNFASGPHGGLVDITPLPEPEIA